MQTDNNCLHGDYVHLIDYQIEYVHVCAYGTIIIVKRSSDYLPLF